MSDHDFGPDDRLAVIAACSTLGADRDFSRPDPLGPQGWSKVAVWLHEHGRRPADLFDPAVVEEAKNTLDDKTIDNLVGISRRAAGTAIELEGLQARGLWALARFDLDYPQRWRDELKGGAPPLIFGAGPLRLLNQPGMAIVGSREIGGQLQEIAGQIGSLIAGLGLQVISGGARGSDRWGMNGALTREGDALGILSGDLDRMSRQTDTRHLLEEGRLTLISHVHPKTGFSAGNAMMRNKYIYALAEATFVIATAEGTGGTWAGANDHLKNGSSPLLVWTGEAAPPANQALVTIGGYPVEQLPETPGDLEALVETARIARQTAPHLVEDPIQPSLFETS